MSEKVLLETSQLSEIELALKSLRSAVCRAIDEMGHVRVGIKEDISAAIRAEFKAEHMAREIESRRRELDTWRKATKKRTKKKGARK